MPRGWSGTFLRHFSCFDLFFVHHHGTNMAPSRLVSKSMKTFEFKFRQMSGKGRALAGRWALQQRRSSQALAVFDDVGRLISFLFLFFLPAFGARVNRSAARGRPGGISCKMSGFRTTSHHTLSVFSSCVQRIGSGGNGGIVVVGEFFICR